MTRYRRMHNRLNEIEARIPDSSYVDIRAVTRMILANLRARELASVICDAEMADGVNGDREQPQDLMAFDPQLQAAVDEFAEIVESIKATLRGDNHCAAG